MISGSYLTVRRRLSQSRILRKNDNWDTDFIASEPKEFKTPKYTVGAHTFRKHFGGNFSREGGPNHK